MKSAFLFVIAFGVIAWAVLMFSRSTPNPGASEAAIDLIPFDPELKAVAAEIIPAQLPDNPSAPDLIIYNTIVRLGPESEALAIHGNRIGPIGPNDKILPLAGKRTRLINARYRITMPGFNDAHVHFLSGGFQLSSVDLRDAKSPEEMARRLKSHADKLPAGQWITGGDWDHELWEGTPLPTRQMIDAATPNHPVFVSRLDGHMALANSVALRIAGVTRDSKSPDGGAIVFDASGEPTGLLKDAAMSFVSRKIPEPAFDAKLAAARAATDHAARLGVTSVQDMSAGADAGVYQELLRRGELKTRIYAVSPLPAWERLARVGLQAPFGNEFLRVGGLKGFSDGSLGSSTALFFDAYSDDSANFGLPGDEMFPPGAMFERIKNADKARLQVMVHAIGDKANAEMLGIFEQVEKENGPRDRRFRIEHAQHLRLSDIPRFARGKVIASMQPYHAADDGRWAEKKIGPGRAKGTYAFASLLEAGVILAFGSDWTVAPLDPIQGILAATTRQTLDGKHPGGWVPEQKISVHEAAKAYTFGSAYAEFAETYKGTVETGKLADLVILSQDIFRMDGSPEVGNTKVMLTIVDGKIVYEAEAAELSRPKSGTKP